MPSIISVVVIVVCSMVLGPFSKGLLITSCLMYMCIFMSIIYLTEYLILVDAVMQYWEPPLMLLSYKCLPLKHI